MQAPSKTSGTERTAGWEVESTGGSAVVRLIGEVDLGVTDPLYEAITAALVSGPGSPGHVTCDLERLAFLDSSGLHLLVRLKADIEEHGGSFSVAAAQGSVQRLFEIVGAKDLFEVID
jgi:anti-anti-sigma factor